MNPLPGKCLRLGRLVGAAILLLGSSSTPAVASGTQTEPAPTRELALRGEGVARYAGFITVYRAELYAPETVSRRELLAGTTPKCLRLRYEVSLTREQIIQAAEKILARQRPAVDLTALNTELSTLHGAYQDVSAGDRYTLCVDSGVTRLWFNGTQTAEIPGLAFAEAYLGIWLGDKAISASLREQLLARIPAS